MVTNPDTGSCSLARDQGRYSAESDPQHFRYDPAHNTEIFSYQLSAFSLGLSPLKLTLRAISPKLYSVGNETLLQTSISPHGRELAVCVLFFVRNVTMLRSGSCQIS